MTLPDQTTDLTIAALYCFAAFDAPEDVAERLRARCDDLAIKGTLILASEGINGTVAGSAAGIDALIAAIRALPGCADMDVKYAHAPTMPFGRMKVKVKAEIVTLGAGDLDPARRAGFHVEPSEWNALIADPDVVVIDTRNDYEVAIGSFERALDPGTRRFRDFPAWFDAQAEQWTAQGRRPKIAMFCTGGIRCEKSTALVKARGFEQVYHLKGGILRYLEDMPPADSLWRGDCFVFDERVAVTHGLAPGRHRMCAGCGHPYAVDGPHQCAAGQDGGGAPGTATS
ncbi:UPF0176 protein [Sphingobium fontiphilum]|uniref:tRNA uridine(34) hydroxylase n=1 Tax=Sphingobium fontiphilum TaxID=944425 RepID=A0A7W6GNV4_9SPHN|nr:rhodanese-related sulfurtransferase [Sphingobium fontiphilum]MBB3982666.1 UPF0176 protein [Sphingobium fontiphilum]